MTTNDLPSVRELSDEELNVLVHGFMPALFVIHKPCRGYYGEKAAGYWSSPELAWKVTEETGRKYTMYADSKPGDNAYPERVVLEPAPIPNYSQSLDACHEMEKTLSDLEHAQYRNSLHALVAPKKSLQIFERGFAHERAYASATARQRSEAFALCRGVAKP